MTRRDALKRGAVVGAGALWIAPAVMALGLDSASAAAPSGGGPPPPPLVTTCAPSLGFLLLRRTSDGVVFATKVSQGGAVERPGNNAATDAELTFLNGGVVVPRDKQRGDLPGVVAGANGTASTYLDYSAATGYEFVGASVGDGSLHLTERVHTAPGTGHGYKNVAPVGSRVTFTKVCD